VQAYSSPPVGFSPDSLCFLIVLWVVDTRGAHQTPGLRCHPWPVICTLPVPAFPPGQSYPLLLAMYSLGRSAGIDSLTQGSRHSCHTLPVIRFHFRGVRAWKSPEILHINNILLPRVSEKEKLWLTLFLPNNQVHPMRCGMTRMPPTGLPDHPLCWWVYSWLPLSPLCETLPPSSSQTPLASVTSLFMVPPLPRHPEAGG
jgi:hypothetical protein